MGYFDGIWKSAIKETEEGTVFYPNGILSSGYIFSEDIIEKLRKFYVNFMKSLFIFVIIAGLFSGHNYLRYIIITAIPLIYYEYKMWMYVKKYGKKSTQRFSVKNHFNNLGSNYGLFSLITLLICSIALSVVSGVFLFNGDFSFIFLLGCIFFGVAAILLSYSLVMHFKKK